MTSFQKKVWFNTEILAVYNDTSGFRDITEYLPPGNQCQ